MGFFKVCKFGGASLANASLIKQVFNIVQNDHNGLVVVLSAMHGITDMLLNAAYEALDGNVNKGKEVYKEYKSRHIAAIDDLIEDQDRKKKLLDILEGFSEELLDIYKSIYTLRDITPRIIAKTVARGERMSAYLFSALLKEQDIPSLYLDAPEIIKIQKQFGSLSPDFSKCEKNSKAKLIPHLLEGKTVVVPGFIGEGPNKDLVTLGRGGSDFSATIIAYGIGANEVILYKEVDGLMTADPKYVPEARIVPEVHYKEAAELAYYGAKVIHPQTIIPLVKKEIPLLIKNTFNPKAQGTRIANDVSPGEYPVKAVTAITGQCLISVEGKAMIGVPGIAGRTFSALANSGVSVSFISQSSSEASICFVVHSKEAETAAEAVRDIFKFELEYNIIEDVNVISGVSIIAVVGLGMSGTLGIASRTFSSLAKNKVNISAIAQGSSELNISMVIDENDTSKAISALHREYRLERLRALRHKSADEVNIVIWGFGQIGRSITGQILDQREYFKDKLGLTCKCVALADSSGLVVSENGFLPEKLQDYILHKNSGKKLNPTSDGILKSNDFYQSLRNKILNLPLYRGIFVDVTAEDTIDLAMLALNSGFHVAVANKKLLTAKQEDFDNLICVAKERNLSLRYEATVGAGLPVLDTLSKLEEAGDEIYAVFGCLSGTLGYLMSELEGGSSFSNAVKKAHSLGYTEPDPREDLSGMDVARKALILARTLGHKLDLGDLRVEALYTPELDSDSPELFMDNLKKLDNDWENRIKTASEKNEVYRYVARIEKEKVSVGLESVSCASPLGRLKGTDNQITLKTRRYYDNPLILTGPGAGAEVTAAGVLNDILAIANTQDRN